MKILKFLVITIAFLVAANAMAQDGGEAAPQSQGSVSIQQDERLQSIVSGEAPVIERKSENTQQAARQQQNSSAAPRKMRRTEIVDVKNLPTFGNRNDFDLRTGARTRAKGYRIQMYWGNSLRTDQLKAKRLGEKVSALYPDLNHYVSYLEPHWRCRVGDFKTRAGAARYLDRLKKITPEATIVRSEIIVYQ